MISIIPITTKNLLASTPEASKPANPPEIMAATKAEAAEAVVVAIAIADVKVVVDAKAAAVAMVVANNKLVAASPVADVADALVSPDKDFKCGLGNRH